ncbi:MAG: FAD-binding oxidoreductase [Candidatus Thiodiazotropha endolucinida]|nr:FAD-binding oxidoreductase [Candidatus Thiodiazotropha taylori]MCW4300229.1 FAD-binding oxidoreductase [Candidatus Thiodiazotropha endolucinida]
MATEKGRKTMSPQVFALKRALSTFIDAERLIDDPLRTLAYGTDASFYRLVPQLVVKVANEAEVSKLLKLANRHDTPVTFRAAGTSLSGQAITDSVLVILEGNAWRDYMISEDGRHIRLQPGIIGAQVNQYLLPHGRKIGPDPASIATCKIGGIAANNASGMCCGVTQNSYQTLSSMRLILADGTLLDTADPLSREAFHQTHQQLLEEIQTLVDEVRANRQLAERIARKFKIKNTTGYSLNALIDFSDPIDVLQHLMIGSEGTLGFIAEITYRTVPEHPFKASALVFFKDVATAYIAVSNLKHEPVDAVEIMDRAALRSVEGQAGMPPELSSLPERAAALLLETRADSENGLRENIHHILSVLNAVETLGDVEFTDLPVEYAKLWKIRKGMFPSVGAVRKTGTTVVIEDIAFPVPRLAEGTVELQHLFTKHGYHNAIIFGHALEGNLHFVITPDFGDVKEIERYHDFMDDLCHMVVEKYDGSLKAEHSTGRNIAPYVELEWGAEAYALMHRIKRSLDPHGLLNPGVILNQDKEVHVKHLKSMAAVDPLVDRCIECGFCEPICPSRELTLTPRQRIVVLREQAHRKTLGVADKSLEPLENFDYAVEETCAGDGLCANRCPVGIDTGQMVKKLRADSRGEKEKRVAKWAEGHMTGVTKATRVGLRVMHGMNRLTGQSALEKTSSLMHKLSGNRLPEWHRWMPRGSTGLIRNKTIDAANGSQSKRCVYFSACVSRSMGASSCDTESRDLIDVVHALLEKGGYSVVTPTDINAQCCGMPFHSKGFVESAETSLNRLEETLWQASEQGRLPILCDTSPCTARMKEVFKRPLRVYEPIGFISQFLLSEMTMVRKVESIALHISCSARKMGLEEDFLAIANACADRVFLPEEEGCCGFAGDKGFVTPELNASALSRLKQQILEDCIQGYSNSRTCEIGLSRHTGIPYRSIAYLIDYCYASKLDLSASVISRHNQIDG